MLGYRITTEGEVEMSKMVNEFVRQDHFRNGAEADRTGEFARRDIALALLTKLDRLYRELASLREDRGAAGRGAAKYRGGARGASGSDRGAAGDRHLRAGSARSGLGRVDVACSLSKLPL